MYLWTLFMATPAPVAGGSDTSDIVSVVITAVISASVFAALITGVVQYLINRRNSRITERKNSVDAESDLIDRYKEAAAEERSAKESAVQTVRNLLAIAEEQVTSLKSTVAALNSTIDNLNKMANTQQEIIDQLTTERDRSVNALKVAQEQIEKQKTDLVRHQREIMDLTYPRSEVDKLRQQAKDDSSVEDTKPEPPEDPENPEKPVDKSE